MASQREEILRQFADTIVSDVQAVAKRFAPSVSAEVSELSMAVKASPYITTLIDGRKPTSPAAPKGDPTLQEIILAWIQERGIQPNEANMSQEALSWAISTSIHQHGDRLWQAGGGRDIFAEVLTKSRIESVANILGDNEQRIFAESVFKNIVI